MVGVAYKYYYSKGNERHATWSEEVFYIPKKTWQFIRSLEMATTFAIYLFSATATKIQFCLFFVFQNYVTEPLSDQNFKPPFLKDTCLFWLKFS